MSKNIVNKGKRLNIRFYIQPRYYHYNESAMLECSKVFETNIPIGEKQKVKDFLNVYILSFLEGKYIYNYEYFKPKDEECGLVLSMTTDRPSNEIDAIYNRLNNMMKQVAGYLVYLNANNIKYHLRALEYYLMLRKTGKWINKDDAVKKSILRMDADSLKSIIEKYTKCPISRYLQRLNILTYIYNDIGMYRRAMEEQQITKTESKKSNVVKLINPTSLAKLILKVNLEYIGPYSKQYCEHDTVYHSYKGIELYFYIEYIENKDWFELLKTTGIKEKLNEMITSCFKASLRKHLGNHSGLYNYDELISGYTTYHSLGKVSDSEINNGTVSVDIKYRYQRNPNILVREDDAISNLLYSFIRGIHNRECDLLDIREFTEWFNDRVK